MKGLAGTFKESSTCVSSGPSVFSNTERVEKERNYYFDLPAADPENDPLHWFRLD